MTPATLAIEAAPGRPQAPARRRRRVRWDLMALIAPLLLLVVAIFDVPLLNTLYWSVVDDAGGLTSEHFREFAESSAYMRIIWRTLIMALEVTAITAIAGYALAYWITKLGPRARMVMLGLVVMTFWVSILVRTYAWIVILGNAGLVNRTLMDLGLISKPFQFLYNELGILIGMVNVLLPFLVLHFMLRWSASISGCCRWQRRWARAAFASSGRYSSR